MSTKTSPVKNANKPDSKKVAGSDAAAAGSGSGGANEQEEPDYSILSDPEDYLEEDESLDMNLRHGDQKIWLVKLPRYLAEKWSNVDQLSGKQLGRVKIRQGGAGGNTSGKLQVKLVLDDAVATRDIPQEYDISMLNTQVKNQYVFSEENLTKFKQELTEMADMPEQPQLQPIDKKEEEQQQSRPYRFYQVQKTQPEGLAAGPPKKFIPYVKTIPKKTALTGKICHDCQIIPLKLDRRYGEVLSQRGRIQQEKARPKVTLLDEIPGVVQSNAGPSIRGNNSLVFLRTGALAKSAAGGKYGEGRAIRMPKKDLLDLLFRLFEEYEYWSMKGLKERTRQPESYLKESLELIANLIKKGPYTSKYNLKPEYKRLRDAERAARLGLVDEAAKSDIEDDDEDEDDMEDVV